MRVREAGPQDVKGIVSVHVSNTSAWFNSKGNPARRFHESLSPYERWLSGGPWMDEGLCRQHLENLLSSGGTALVAEVGSRILGEIAAIPSLEREGRALHISLLYVHKDHQGKGLGRALLEVVLERAQARGCDLITVWPEDDARGFYEKLGFVPIYTGARVVFESTGGGDCSFADEVPADPP